MDIIQHFSSIIISHWYWIIQLFIILLLTWGVNVLLQYMLRRFTHKSDSFWGMALVSSFSMPLRAFIWLGGIGGSLELLNKQFSITLFDTLLSFRVAVMTLLVGWFLLQLNYNAFKILRLKSDQPIKTTLDLAKKISTACIIVGMALMLLPSLGISINGIVAFGGIGGIVVGMAAKDLLANFFGAVMIHIDHPFVVGDWISLPEKNIQGTVENIGWRQIIVRTFNTRQVFIPNSMFGNIILENPSRMTHRRLCETIGIRYDDVKKLPPILSDIRALLESSPEIDQEQDIIVNFNAFSAYSVDFIVWAYSKHTKWTEFLKIKENLMLAISDIITSHGAEIAFPTQVMQIKQDNTDTFS